ncbi:MAG: DUF616 domain-containing protein [Candidatus Ochrobactrum gambitense]|nr:MAG: DUF616 domain-containing protein [Candidatus Ochrobactrum gambitense]WEK16971.1 MAG: rhamnan synthesis F family protein [Candidatus Ochrobactrum gambitense]
MRKYIRKFAEKLRYIELSCSDLRNYAIISRSDLFDKEWYIAHNPDVKSAGVNPVIHFMRNGDREGRNPGPFFDGHRYLQANPDVRQAQFNSLLHYLKYGRTERRLLTPSRPAEKSSLSESSATGGLIRTRELEYGPIDQVLEFDHVSKINPRLSMCVHLHLFHTDCAAEFVSYLKHIPVKFSLFISVQANEDVDSWRNFFSEKLSQLNECIVKRCDNQGRDVSPWVVLFKEEILNHDIFVHAHSKKSNYDKKYRFWRKFLFHNILGSKGIASQIYSIFESDSTVGLVYPAYYGETRAQPAWGANKDLVDELSERILGRSGPDNCPDFPGGSFFWCRSAILKPLLEAGLSIDDFHEEKGQVDGTLAHAIERFIGILGSVNGYRKICVTADVAYNLTGYWDRSRASRVTNSANDKLEQFQIKLPSKNGKVAAPRVAVCTAVAGGFDELVGMPTVELGVDYYCFTDKPVEVPQPFKNRLTPYIDPNPRKTARFVKTHAHYFFPDYDVVVWIDANIVPINGILRYVELVLKSDADIGIIRHPVRSGYIEEAQECIRIGADDSETLKEQVDYYNKLDLENERLVETNIFISRPNRGKVQKLFDVWWREINNRSIRDQISLRYAIWKSGVKEIEIFEPGVSTRDEAGFIHFAHDVKGRSKIVDFVMKSLRD